MDININQNEDLDPVFLNNNGNEEEEEEEEEEENARNVRRRLNEDGNAQNLLQNVANNEDPGVRAVEQLNNFQVVPVGHHEPHALRTYDRRRETEQKRSSANRAEPFKTLVEISRQNIEPVRNASGMLDQRQHLSQNARLISLQTLQSSGTRYNTFLLLYILSISGSRTGGSSVSHTRHGNNRNATPLRHNRKVILMCPLSPPGSNTCVVLTGNGSSADFLNGVEINLRDTGSLRKYICMFYFISFCVNSISLSCII